MLKLLKLLFLDETDLTPKPTLVKYAPSETGKTMGLARHLCQVKNQKQEKVLLIGTQTILQKLSTMLGDSIPPFPTPKTWLEKNEEISIPQALQNWGPILRQNLEEEYWQNLLYLEIQQTLKENPSLKTLKEALEATLQRLNPLTNAEKSQTKLQTAPTITSEQHPAIKALLENTKTKLENLIPLLHPEKEIPLLSQLNLEDHPQALHASFALKHLKGSNEKITILFLENGTLANWAEEVDAIFQTNYQSQIEPILFSQEGEPPALLDFIEQTLTPTPLPRFWKITPRWGITEKLYKIPRN